MPSAEKVSAEAVKLESGHPNGQKKGENAQKENAAEQEKNVPAIQQVISIISNKVRNLEKRKVSYKPLRPHLRIDLAAKIEIENALFFNMASGLPDRLNSGKEFLEHFFCISEQARWLHQRGREWQGVKRRAADGRV